MRSGLKRRGYVLVLVLALALVAAACSSDDTSDTTAATTSTTEAEMMEGAVKTCLVTDLAGVDDRSFNASAWQGVQDAMAAGYATEDSFFLESADASDWQPNIDQFVSQGCEHIVTVGFALGEVTAINAAANPDITWTMIDNVLTDENFAPLGLENVRELVYQTDQAAFAAGYLSAGVTQTGTACTYGGGNFPTVSIFMDGFTRGVAHYNEIKGTDVEVLGWDSEAGDGVFTGSFTDMDLARATAESLFQEGCDIIIPVGGAINLPAGDLINEGQGLAMIGVDADAYFAMPEAYQPVWLTTVEKAIAPFIALAVQEQVEGTWTSGSFVGNLENGGVGLSPFHDWDDDISVELKGEVAQLLEDIKNGVVKADFTPVGY
jgi:basic membrane protein A